MFSKVGSTPSTLRALDLVGVLIEETRSRKCRGHLGWPAVSERSGCRSRRLRRRHRLHGYRVATALKAFLSDLRRSASDSKVLAPPSIASSTKASRVPLVGGGPENLDLLVRAATGRSRSTSCRDCRQVLPSDRNLFGQGLKDLLLGQGRAALPSPWSWPARYRRNPILTSVMPPIAGFSVHFFEFRGL